MEKVMKHFILALFALTVIVSVTLRTDATNIPFSDVPPSSWYRQDVQYVYENRLMNGTTSSTFEPQGHITRGMIVAILHRLDNTPSVLTDCPFADVGTGRYYRDAITWAVSHGIVNGYTAVLFGPDDDVTRQQLSTILFRFAQFKGYETVERSDLSGFADKEEISSYAVESMAWANAEKLINGNAKLELMPKGNATRAQAAAILTRFCQNVVSHDNEDSVYTIQFFLNDGSETVFKTEQIHAHTALSEPDAPERTGYLFSGWYTEPVGGFPYQFESPVSDPLSLYAHWTEKNTNSADPNHHEDSKSGDSGGQDSGTVSNPPTVLPTESAGSGGDGQNETKGKTNVFQVAVVESPDGKTMEVSVKLGGEVSLCGFDLDLQYDNTLLELREINDDHDLEIFSGHNGDTGRVSFNYSGVRNIVKPKLILTLSFHITGSAGSLAKFTLIPKEIIKTDDRNRILPADYQLMDETITIR